MSTSRAWRKVCSTSEIPNAKGYSDFRKMYENKDIQGVVVATPDHWHALLTIMACAAGKDVYVEKPMTVFIDEGRWMIQAARKYKRIVVVGTQRRHAKVRGGQEGHRKRPAWEDPMSTRIASYRNIYPGFGKTPVEDPPPEFRLRHVARSGAQEAVPGASRPVPFPLVLGLFRRPVDQPGGSQLVAVLLVMSVKGPTKVVSSGGRFTLEDDGETPDTQDASSSFRRSCEYGHARSQRLSRLHGLGHHGQQG